MYDLKTKNVACDVVAEDVAASNLALAFLDKAVVIAKNPDFTVVSRGLATEATDKAESQRWHYCICVRKIPRSDF